MKILRIIPENTPSTEYIRKNKNKLIKMNYVEVKNTYERENLYFPCGLSAGWRRVGNDVMDIFFWDPLSQSKWLEENSPHFLFKLSEFDWFEKIIQEQINHFKPDIIFFQSGTLYRCTAEFRKYLKSSLKSNIPFIAQWGDEIPSGISPTNFFGSLDAIIFSTEMYLNKYKTLNLSAELHYLPTAFDEFIDYEDASGKKKYELIHIGATGYLASDHFERYLSLYYLLKNDSRIVFAGYEPKRPLSHYILHYLLFILFGIFSKIPRKIIEFIFNIIDKINKSINIKKIIIILNKINIYGSVFHFRGINFYRAIGYKFSYILIGPLSKAFKNNYLGTIHSYKSYYKIISQSKIALNFHRDEKEDVGNIRVFEIPGLRTLLLTNRSDELSKIFPQGGIYGFNNVSDISIKVDELLKYNNYDELVDIGYRQIFEKHTMSTRSLEFIDIFNKILAKNELCNTKIIYKIYIYDLRSRPLSYDFIFFMQYVHINSLDNKFIPRILIIYPTNFSFDYGFTEEVFLRRFRNIIIQIANEFPHIIVDVTNINNLDPVESFINNKFSFELDEISLREHHREFYKCVNQNYDKIYKIRADLNYLIKSKEYIGTKPSISFTVRNSTQYHNRNSNVNSWTKIINKLHSLSFTIIVVPDTDNKSPIENIFGIKVFDWAAYDFKARLALYESCDLNIFVNNGPCIASELNDKIRSITFKLVEETTPHTTIEYIESQGYTFNESPKYNENSLWVWEDDDYEIMHREILKALKINV